MLSCALHLIQGQGKIAEGLTKLEEINKKRGPPQEVDQIAIELIAKYKNAVSEQNKKEAPK